MMAIPISRGIKPIAESACRATFKAVAVPILLLLACPAQAAATNQPAGSTPAAVVNPAVRIRKAFFESRARLQSQKTNAEAAWQFSRACFDLADIATTDAERAETAQGGI